MYINISANELLELENAKLKLQALEQGGVDNWEWYGESLNKYKPITKLTEYGLDFEIKYSQGETVYYNNTSCEFVSYISKKFAVVEIELEPDFDIDSSYHCAGCMIGDSDNKIPCKCDEVRGIVNNIEENTEPTFIPLIVQVKKLHKKPIVMQKHEKEIEVLKNRKEELKTSAKELLKKKVDLAAEIQKMEQYKKQLDELNNI